MTRASRLRVAIPDVSSALGVVTAEVREATGFTVHPEFQEVDHGELIVEINLPDAGDCQPREVAQMVEDSVPAVEVLSTWSQTPVLAGAYPARTDHVVDLSDAVLPDLARRAVDDQLPTAQWHSRTDHDVAHWDLAVPVFAAHRPVVVGIRRRNGYALRFSALEADAIAKTLAS